MSLTTLEFVSFLSFFFLNSERVNSYTFRKFDQSFGYSSNLNSNFSAIVSSRSIGIIFALLEYQSRNKKCKMDLRLAGNRLLLRVNHFNYTGWDVTTIRSWMLVEEGNSCKTIGTFVLAVMPHDEVCLVRCTCGTTTLWLRTTPSFS